MKKILRSLVVIFIVLILMSYSNISNASKMTDLQNEQQDIKNEINSTEDELEKVAEERSKTYKEVTNLVTQISSYEDEIDELNSKISSLKKKISEAEKQIKEDEEDYEEQQEALDARLVAMYKTGETSYLDFMLSSANLMDFISSYYLISQVAEYDTRMLEQIEEHKEKIEKEKAELEADKKELDKSKTTVESKQKALQVAKKEKEEKVAKLTEEEATLAEELEELKKQESKVSTQIKKLKEEYDRKLAQERATNGSGSTSSNGATNGTYGFGWPVADPSTLGTLYGVSGRYWSLGYHTGIDFRVSTGTPVYSIGDGQVVDCGTSSAYGKYVEIYHGNNIYSLYAHNSSISVSIGSYVTKGQKISSSGATGNVTGPHLHFEIRTPGPKFANCVNPLPYLP